MHLRICRVAFNFKPPALTLNSPTLFMVFLQSNFGLHLRGKREGKMKLLKKIFFKKNKTKTSQRIADSIHYPHDAENVIIMIISRIYPGKDHYLPIQKDKEGKRKSAK